MEQRTQGILLYSKDIGEADQMVQFFTLGYGRLVFRARGAKRSKRRFTGLLESFSHHELTFQQRRTGQWPVLVNLEPIDMHTDLRTDLGAFSAASYVAELFVKLTEEGDPNPSLFQLLSSFLTYSTHQPLSPKALCRLHLRLLADLGLQPDWHRCMECGRSFEAHTFFSFDLAQGGLRCQECSPPQGRNLRPLRAATQELLTQLQHRQALHLPDPLPWADALYLLNARINHLMGNPPRSRSFLYQMNPTLPTDSNPEA